MATTTLSLRIPQDMRERLDQATRKTRRSRSQIVQMALERHLDQVAAAEKIVASDSPTALIRSLAGAGASTSTFRSAEEIDAHIRWLRERD